MRVSVVVPCHNSLRFLPSTLDSILAQDLPTGVELEVVLVDDGGSDDLAGWAAQRGDPRVRVVRQDNAGVSAARNRGIREATGELIAFCDSDDLWVPTTVAALVGALGSDPGAGLAYGWYDVIDAEGRPTGRVTRSDWEGEIWDRLVTDNPIAASGVMVRREVFDDVGGFAENRDRFRIDVEDWELWIRVAARWRIALARRVVARHRRHDSNSSTDVESLEAAYRHLLDVVFADATPERRRMLPAASAQVDLRLAWHWLNDRDVPTRAASHLRAAAARHPEIRRTVDYRRARVATSAARLTGPRGRRAMQALSRAARRRRQPGADGS